MMSWSSRYVYYYVWCRWRVLAYRNKIGCIEIGDEKLNDIYLNFGIIDEEGIINGLLGLDVLMKLGIKINLNKSELK